MPADISHVKEVYSTQSKVHLLAQLNAVDLTNRSYEGDARGAAKVYVTTSVRPTGGATTNVARDGDWASPRTLGTAQDEFPIDQRYDAAMRVPMDDTLDIPIDLVNEAAFFNARDMAEAVDAQVYKEVLDNVEAAQKTTLGTASVYIDLDGVGHGTDAIDLVPDYLQGLRTKLMNEHKLHTGLQDFTWRVDMSPALLRTLDNWLLDNDQGISRTWKDQVVLGSGITNKNYQYDLWGFSIYVTTQIPATSVSSKSHAQLIVSNPIATTMAMRTPLQQVFSPQENQSDKPGYLFRERIWWGVKVIDPRFVYSAQVRTEA